MQFVERVKFLVTGKAEWVDAETGESYVEYETWHTRWLIAGPHSHYWWWVRKYGKLDCGCTCNPLTRRRLLINAECVRDGWLVDDA